MVTPVTTGFETLAQRLHELCLRAFVDLYAARTAEVWWAVSGGQVHARRELLREGAAVRSDGSFASADGLDRIVLAELLGVPARTLPAFDLAPFPRPPVIAAAVAALGATDAELHWRGGWAILVAGGAAVALPRPQLLEVALPDGQRSLATWPPAADWRPPRPAAAGGGSPRPGRHRVVLAPAAAAVLFHELLAHPLEGDLLVRGASPFAGRHGERLFALPVDVDDDPTQATLPGAFTVDDEGVTARRRALVRGGVLAGVLCDRATAALLGGPAGCARRAGVHAPPRPRVSNLVVRAPAGAVDALRRAASIEVESLASGSVEPRTGTVTLVVRSARALRRGAPDRPLAGFVLAGSVSAALGGVEALAGPPEAVAEPGWCSKDGEVVATGALAPWLLLSGMEVR